MAFYSGYQMPQQQPLDPQVLQYWMALARQMQAQQPGQTAPQAQRPQQPQAAVPQQQPWWTQLPPEMLRGVIGLGQNPTGIDPGIYAGGPAASWPPPSGPTIRW